jgi:hypothetical protein
MGEATAGKFSNRADAADRWCKCSRLAIGGPCRRQRRLSISEDDFSANETAPSPLEWRPELTAAHLEGSADERLVGTATVRSDHLSRLLCVD